MTRFFGYAIMPVLALQLCACSQDTTQDLVSQNQTTVQEAFVDKPYPYQEKELEILEVINDYRASIGLNRLQYIDHASFIAEEHNAYMISKNSLNHDYFDDRAQDIIRNSGAKRVYENVARNFTQAPPLLQAWLNSPGHKANIEGDFTHFGLSVSVHPETGKLYCTNIFVKI